MRRTLTFSGFLLAFAFTSAALAAGRGGFEAGGGGAQPHSAPPAGSGSFRPSGGGEVRHSFEPAGGGGGRAPIARPPAPVFQRPAVEAPRAPQPVPGRASILPSLNAGNRVLTPRVVQPNLAPQAARPEQRSSGENDFLGLRPESRQAPANRPSPAINPGIVSRPNAAFPAARAPGLSAARAILPNPPGRLERAARPALPERWRNVSNNFNIQFNRWQQANTAGIASFQSSRTERWSQIQQRGNDRNWPRQFRSPAYQNWRRDVWNFRRDRAEEVWAATRDLHENLFDDHWWSTAWWRRNSWNNAADVSPWWWWNGATWADTTAFFGSTIGQEPIPYDPGTNAFYDGDSYVLDGQAGHGTAADASDQAAELAGPPVDDDAIPVPEPPADGQAQEWLFAGRVGSYSAGAGQSGDVFSRSA